MTKQDPAPIAIQGHKQIFLFPKSRAQDTKSPHKHPNKLLPIINNNTNQPVRATVCQLLMKSWNPSSTKFFAAIRRNPNSIRPSVKFWTALGA